MNMRDGIGKAYFADLLIEFLAAHGYTIYKDGRQVEYPPGIILFLRSFFNYLFCVAALTGRVSLAAMLEIKFVPSKRSLGTAILRMRTHGEVNKFLRNKKTLDPQDQYLDKVKEVSFEMFNEMLDFQDHLDHDQIVVSDQPRL